MKNGPLGIFRLKPEAKVKGKDSTSAYVGFLFIVGFDLYPAKCE